MIRTIAIGSLLAAIWLAAGCTPTVIDTACQSFTPITYSASRDTPDTVLQVRRHNAAWDTICK
ncbi:hypothetical protein [Vineibacter terrae]|uniref:hypothetical protein n=1 Tax=Vineibacter terrae TaxID=2586908 RepID=UPI002E32789D|nr:hypothetical protein [Vineibacter terrae]HEX2888089.1 hypothetical protein [Vineibacter terrae]